MNILRYFKRRRQQLKKREYLFEGVVWVHEQATVEQAAKAGQVIYRLIKATECGDIPLNELLGKLLNPEAMAELLEILLIPSADGKRQAETPAPPVDFKRFPAEDAWEVVTDFFIWNKNSAQSILMSSAAMLGINLGTSGKEHTPEKDAAL